jgi:hypothetical protein
MCESYTIELKMKTDLYNSLGGLYPYPIKYEFKSISEMVKFKEMVDEMYKIYRESV